MALSVGTSAPDFTLRTKTADGLADVKLSDNFGQRPTVLLFFPAAFTGVCTQEMCDVSAALHDFAGAAVYGVSGDTVFAQAEWKKQNAITVELLSDYSKQVAQAYDVVLPDLAGMGSSAKRAAFVIDRQGVVRYAEETPTPADLPDFEKIRATVASL